jgi:23S rRNA-/tRNA-specific pseudouridylate synthase
MDFPSEEPREPRVVFEDEWLLAVDKPARMHSVPGLGAGDLCAWVFERYPELMDLGPEARNLGPEAEPARRAGGGEGGLLHRLDYETSGLVLFARKASAFTSLLDQQERGLFYKEYLALSAASREAQPQGSAPSAGIPRGIEAEDWRAARDALDGMKLSKLIGEAIAGGGCGISAAFRSFGPRGARVACLDPAGASKPYLSDLLGCSSSAEGMELRVGISRGFRHQIRAQLAWIGLPIKGDPLYGGASDSRLRLYARRLSFVHPASGRPFSLDSPDSR